MVTSSRMRSSSPLRCRVDRVGCLGRLAVLRTLAVGAALFIPLVPLVARGAQTDVTISMIAPGAAPRIIGPAVVSARPATPFLYTVAATGTRPLTFTAAGLPAGLNLITASGTITGTAPAAGSYPIAVTVSNAAGSA